MIWAAPAALFAGLFAWPLRALVWGVPMRLVPRGVIVRGGLGSFATAFLLALFTYWLFGLTGVSRTWVDVASAACGGFLALFFAYRSSSRDRERRGITLLAAEATRPEADAASLARLEIRLAKLRAKNPAVHAGLALALSGPLALGGRHGAAHRMLGAIDPEGLSVPERAIRAQALATCALRLGKLEEAEAALDEVSALPEQQDLEAWVGLTRGFIAAIQGNVEAGLAAAKAARRTGDDSLRASAMVVEAHAEACRGRTSAAEKALDGLVELAGHDGLALAIQPVGPATELARARALAARESLPA